MEQHHQHQNMTVHDNIEQQEEQEELEYFSLKRTIPHVKVNNNINNNNLVVTDVVVTSSSVSNGDGHSNGSASTVNTDPDGFSLQKEEEVEEKGNVDEYNSDVGDDKEDIVPVGLGLVAEFVGEEATNGETITSSTFGTDLLHSNNSIYLDKQQGNEVNGFNGVQNGYATNHEENKFDAQVENSAIQNGLCSEIDDQCMRTVDDKLPCGSELPTLHNSSDIQVTPAVNFHEETEKEINLTKENDQQEKEFDVELVLAKQETHDLFCPNCKSCITKRVILKKRKRNIHILDDKAKRDKLDPVVVDNNVVNSTIDEVNQGGYANVASEITSLEPPAGAGAAAAADDDDDHHPEREVEVFRCLSCFSIFIPSGKGFNLFSNFGGANKHETSQNSSSIAASSLQNSSNTPSSNSNWFISLFTSNKGKTATEQVGDTSREPSRNGPADQQQSTNTSTIPSSPDIGHPEGPLADAAQIKNVKPITDVNHGNGKMISSISSNGVKSVEQDFIDYLEKEQSQTGKLMTDNGDKKNTSVDTTTTTNNVEVMSSMNFSNGTVSKYESVKSVTVTSTSSETHVSSGETSKGAILNHSEEKPEFLVPTSATAGSQIIEKLQKDMNKTLEIAKNNDSSLWQGGIQSPVQSFESTVHANDVASDKLSSGIDAIFPSKPDITLIDKVRQDINSNINPSVQKENKGDVIVVVDGEAIDSTTLQTTDNVPVDRAIVTESQTHVGIGEQPRDEIGEPKKREIIKSIVYGGLVESITSLGIVSSAASSGATPLNIIVLGFANLIGGLFILGHNLTDLKNDHSGEQQLQTNAQDRYQELLGRRSNFLFHTVVAVLSFLIFGSVPLIIYGVLINKNYYDEVKLAIIAATSVACIILLTIGKVYTQRPPKSYIKTVLYYVTMALAASGISFIAGKLIKDLIEKLSQSDSGFAIKMPISDSSMETAWMSY